MVLTDLADVLIAEGHGMPAASTVGVAGTARPMGSVQAEMGTQVHKSQSEAPGVNWYPRHWERRPSAGWQTLRSVRNDIRGRLGGPTPAG